MTNDDITIRVDLPTDDAAAPRNLTRLARILYEVHRQERARATESVLSSLKTWDQLPPAARRAWRAVAAEAAFQVTGACKQQIGTAVAGELRYPMLPEER